MPDLSLAARAENRRVVPVAINILYGATVLLRAAMLRFQGVALPAGFPRVVPIGLDEMKL